MAKAEETATSLLQLSNDEDRTRTHPPGEELLDKAMAAQHWVAIGEEDSNTVKASVERKISDGMLFRVAVSIAGRRCVALIDSGASQSYIAPETVTLCELECEPAVLHLELADGSKIKATQQTKVTNCTVGEAVSKINFTVTNLLSNVDLVLGMDWLVQWNPVIDWRRQILNLYVNRHWTQVYGTSIGFFSTSWHCKSIGPLYCGEREKTCLSGWCQKRQKCGMYKRKLQSGFNLLCKRKMSRRVIKDVVQQRRAMAKSPVQ